MAIFSEFLEAGPLPLMVEDACLGTREPFYLLRRSVEQLTPRWKFISTVEKGHDILLEVETKPQKPYVGATTSVFLNLPDGTQIDPNHSEMKLGKLEGVPDDETCYRVCVSLGDLRNKLGPGFQITTIKHYLNRGPKFTVVTGIQKKQANGLQVVGYYKEKYYRKWYQVH
ncbi:uncharacterized protein FRV6_08826 [Fusarium oxysporum]|uniref:Uncharacterized protein n=1 Tax=Fusarium oxysporum TaxID=5507 RepID=A0A2H3TS57_FUSOX|nr:uncharacterized protein FRV6_08826 [Fusarium oxysporum]